MSVASIAWVTTGASQVGIVRCAGQSKIADQRTVNFFFQQNVRWLAAAMYQSLLMRGRQPGGDLHADSQDLAQFQRTFAVNSCLLRLDGID